MTLCIAAHAMNHRDIRNQIVVCSDSLIGDEASVSEDTTKWAFVSDAVVCLYSGSLDHAEDAIAIYKSRFKATPLDLLHCKEQVHMAFEEVKDSLKRRAVKRVDIDLIIAGFIETEPRIIQANSRGVWSLPAFATIGAGALVADAVLRLRKPFARTDSSEVLYYVYEAKRLAEASPFVGKVHTDIWVLEEYYDSALKARKIEWKRLHKSGLDYLHAQFERFGLQSYQGRPEAFPWGSLHFPKCPM